jgi:hypothetical protein
MVYRDLFCIVLSKGQKETWRYRDLVSLSEMARDNYVLLGGWHWATNGGELTYKVRESVDGVIYPYLSTALSEIEGIADGQVDFIGEHLGVYFSK